MNCSRCANFDRYMILTPTVDSLCFISNQLYSQFFLMGSVEERPWWPIQSPNKGRKKKAKS